MPLSGPGCGTHTSAQKRHDEQGRITPENAPAMRSGGWRGSCRARGPTSESRPAPRRVGFAPTEAVFHGSAALPVAATSRQASGSCAAAETSGRSMEEGPQTRPPDHVGVPPPGGARPCRGRKSFPATTRRTGCVRQWDPPPWSAGSRDVSPRTSPLRHTIASLKQDEPSQDNLGKWFIGGQGGRDGHSQDAARQRHEILARLRGAKAPGLWH